MKEKRFSVRMFGSQVSLIEDTAARLHISNSEVIRSFITEDKIVIITEFDKMLPALIKLTKILEKNEVNEEYSEVKKGVEAIWQLLNIAMGILNKD